MSDVTGVNVSVKLKVKAGTQGPGEAGAVEFRYEPGPDATALGAIVCPNGYIDLTNVKSEVRLQFNLVEPSGPEPSLKWGADEYLVRVRSNKADRPERDTLLVGKGVKPENPSQLTPYPVAGKEFIAFYYSGNGNDSIHVHTRNADKSSDYWYALGINLRRRGEKDPAKDIVCRHDPQIKNGGNTGVSLGPIWRVAGFIVLANIVANLLIRVFVQPT